VTVTQHSTDIASPVGWCRIGEGIRRRRRDLSLDRSHAAERAALPKRIWQRLEDGYGGHLSDEVLVAAARALDLNPTTLMKRCGRPPGAGEVTASDGKRPPAEARAEWSRIGVTTRRRRKELDLDQSDAAKRAWIPKAIWKDLEDGYGQSLSDEAGARVAKVLALDPALFALGGGRPAPAAAEAEVEAAAEAAKMGAHVAEAERRAAQAEDRAISAEVEAARARKAAERATERARVAEALTSTTEQELAAERLRAAEVNRTCQQLRKTLQATMRAKAAAERRASEQAPAGSNNPPARKSGPNQKT
jgi:hypothetical protein